MKVYQGSIDYADHSSYLFNDPSLEKVSQIMKQGLDYYKNNGETIREAKIEALCDKCYNDGTYMKPTRNKLVRKSVPCDCKKQYASEVYQVNY
jgi:hypothetical protein